MSLLLKDAANVNMSSEFCIIRLLILLIYMIQNLLLHNREAETRKNMVEICGTIQIGILM